MTRKVLIMVQSILVIRASGPMAAHDRPDAIYRRALKSRMNAMSICFAHTPKLRKTLSLGQATKKFEDVHITRPH